MATITIEGTTDLCLNGYNVYQRHSFVDVDYRKPNEWEEIITSVHWRDPLPTNDTYHDCNKTMMQDLLLENAPCIAAFALRKSFRQTIADHKFAKNPDKMCSALNIIAKNMLIPVRFDKWDLRECVFQTKARTLITKKVNFFSGWSASFDIEFLGDMFPLTSIVETISFAGFNIGVGGLLNCGYGRYKVVDVK